MSSSHLDAAGRLPGIDLARGLAVLGMFAAHLLWIEPLDAGRPDTWIDLANGRSSVLFATLAGVSIGLVTGGVRPYAGQRLRAARLGLVYRAVLLWLIGLMLIATAVPVYVILPAYAVLFLLAQTLLTLSARTLWIVAAVTALVMPWLQPLLDPMVLDAPYGAEIGLALGWHYPFTVWFAFLAAGLAATRSDLRSARTQVWLAVGGAVAAAVGYGIPSLLRPEPGTYLGEVWTADAHSSGLWEVVGSGGWALMTLGLCLLLCRVRVVRAVLLPLRAVGSMPLTAYVGQLVVWAGIAALVLGDAADLSGFRELQPFWPFVITTLVACTAWALLLGRGPLERLTAWICRVPAPA